MDQELFDLTMSCLSPEQQKHVEERHINNTDFSRSFLMGFEHGASEAARMSADRGPNRSKVIDELIADTVWMDAWARDARQQERMSETRKTIIEWLQSRKQ